MCPECERLKKEIQRLKEELLLVIKICADKGEYPSQCPSCGNYPNMGRGMLRHTSGTWSAYYPCGDPWHSNLLNEGATLPRKENHS